MKGRCSWTQAPLFQKVGKQPHDEGGMGRVDFLHAGLAARRQVQGIGDEIPGALYQLGVRRRLEVAALAIFFVETPEEWLAWVDAFRHMVAGGDLCSDMRVHAASVDIRAVRWRNDGGFGEPRGGNLQDAEPLT